MAHSEQDCSKLIGKLLDCLSVALDLEPDFFSRHSRGSIFVSSLTHYPTVSAGSLRSGLVMRAPAHSDFGILALLSQQEAGGLEVADMSSTE